MSQETVRKYYLVEGAAKPVAGIHFDPYEIIGSVLYGIYATDKPAEIEAIDNEITKHPKRGVSVLSAEEYNTYAQKKIPSSLSSQYSPPKPVITEPRPLQPPIKGNGAVVDLNPNPPAPEPEVIPIAAPVAKADDALSLGEVAASPTNPPRQSQKGKKA